MIDLPNAPYVKRQQKAATGHPVVTPGRFRRGLALAKIRREPSIRRAADGVRR